MAEPDLLWVAQMEHEGAFYVVEEIQAIASELAQALADQQEGTFTVTIKQMERGLYDALPEFDGF
jgi:hypothetical protein